MTRTEAINLLDTYVENQALKKHCLAVGAVMKYYAPQYKADSDLWEVTGILHDMDYEKYPAIHPDKSLEILEEMGEDPDMIHAIKAHRYTDEIASDIDKALFASDEISGFVVACIWVRPDRSIASLEPASVKKKLKDKAFARSVSREDIAKGAALLEIDITDHIAHVIEALTAAKEELGL